MATNPAATTEFGIPLMPAEREELFGRPARYTDVVAVVIPYGERQPDDWAGAWVDQSAGGVVVAQFAGNVEAHREALAAMLAPNAALELRQVQWSLRELEALRSQIVSERGWFRGVGAELIRDSVHTKENLVFIKVSATNPAIGAIVMDHFQAHGRLRVESDGTGLILLPEGDLTVTAVDGQGRPVAGLQLFLTSDVPGTSSSDPVCTTNNEGICETVAKAASYELDLRQKVGSGWVVVGHATIRVVGNRENIVRVTVQVE